MVEILVVLLIIGILAAVATPLYLAQTQRAKASEAVATMGMIRAAERDYFGRSNSYLNVSSGNLSTALGVNVGTSQYFSNAAYSVAQGAAGASGLFTTPGAVDFVVTATGTASVPCSGNLTDCAIKAGDVADYLLEMDNSGRAFVSYNNGTAWSAW